MPIPNTEDLERNVLADAVCAPDLLGDIIPVVHPEFFTSDVRRRIWDTIVDHYNKGDEVGVNIGAVIGKDFFTEVVPHMEGAGMSDTPFRAQLLRDGAARRRAYFAAAEFLKGTEDNSRSEQDIIASMERFARSVEGPSPLQGERKLDTVIDEVKDEIRKTEKAVNAGRSVRITTGFRHMDLVLNGGLKAGQLVILAARPSVGKTALMLQMAKAAAVDGRSVQVFSLEMTAAELAERLIYSTGQVRPYQVNNGCVEWKAFSYAENALRPLPFYINDFSRSLDEIVSQLTQAVKKGRCDVAFIDYLGLMQDALSFGNAKLYQVIARITGTLKALAKRLEIPIVLLCQLNRDAAREDRTPQLYDLRDSGSIEQDADVVLMLESKMASENKLYVWLRKNRAGKKEVGFVLAPNDTYSAFTEENPILPAGTSLPAAPAPEPLFGSEDKEDENNDLPF
ncbi:MAG: AAA family ATPase [Clostridia bacterium]|nr:AAA family ATPase [Clostridia bacterium]